MLILGINMQLFNFRNNCWVMWLPAVVEAFSSAISLNATGGSTSLCSIISSLSSNNATETVDVVSKKSLELIMINCNKVRPKIAFSET